MTYRFEHDLQSEAFYIRVREGDYHETVPLREPGFGAGADVDAEGNVLGFEFLCFEDYEELVELAGGSLAVPEQLEASFERARSGTDEDLTSSETAVTLTPRERKVLRLLAEGLSTREVADRLSVPLGTVKAHFRHLVEVFEAKSTEEPNSRLSARE